MVKAAIAGEIGSLALEDANDLFSDDPLGPQEVSLTGTSGVTQGMQLLRRQSKNHSSIERASCLSHSLKRLNWQVIQGVTVTIG